MSPTVRKFNTAVFDLLSRGIYPSPGKIEAKLGHRVRHNLNGRECKWREQVLLSEGWSHSPAQRRMNGLSWRPPIRKRLVQTSSRVWHIIDVGGEYGS
mgnify:CR=1 FL=1